MSHIQPIWTVAHPVCFIEAQLILPVENSGCQWIDLGEAVALLAVSQVRTLLPGSLSGARDQGLPIVLEVASQCCSCSCEGICTGGQAGGDELAWRVRDAGGGGAGATCSAVLCVWAREWLWSLDASCAC
jgi:hypothetical protein